MKTTQFTGTAPVHTTVPTHTSADRAEQGRSARRAGTLRSTGRVGRALGATAQRLSSRDEQQERVRKARGGCAGCRAVARGGKGLEASGMQSLPGKLARRKSGRVGRLRTLVQVTLPKSSNSRALVTTSMLREGGRWSWSARSKETMDNELEEAAIGPRR